MKTKCFFIAVILFSTSYLSSQTTYSFNDGLKAAKSQGKMIFIDIFSSSDSWSKKMDDEVYSSPKVQSALSGFIFIKLNAGGQEKFSYNGKEYSSSALAKLFGGTGYPTFVVMNPDGSVIRFKYNNDETSSVSGFIGENDFVEMLGYFLQGKYKDTDLSSVFQN